MSDIPQNHWEPLLARELKRLPDHRAPATLVPRVMAAIRAEAVLPWYQRGWACWPLAAKAAFLAMAMAGLWVLINLGYLGNATGFISLAGQQVNDWLNTLALWRGVLETLNNALGLVLSQFSRFYLITFAGVILAGYLACVGFGTAVYYMVFPTQPLIQKGRL